MEAISRTLHRCPHCDVVGVKRKGTGIWECKKCGFKFAGGAYQPQTPVLKIALRTIERSIQKEA